MYDKISRYFDLYYEKVDKIYTVNTKRYIRESTQMYSRFNTIIIILALSLPGIISGRICRQHCDCRLKDSKIDKLQGSLNQVNHANNVLLSKGILLGDDFALHISNNGNTIGYIYDEYKPSMTIPTNSQIQVISKPKNINIDTKHVRIFYDANHNGLFTDLSIPGNYNSSQISLPQRSISSITIPSGFQVILYSEDNFQGNHIVLTDSRANFDNFNDRTVSIELIKEFTKKPEHVAVAYSHPEYSGKQHGLVVGNNTISSSQLKSIMIDSDYEVLIYSNDVLIDIIRPTEDRFNNPRRIQIISPEKVFNTVVQKQSEQSNKYIVFYDDINFKGTHFIIKANSTSIIPYTNGKLSSIHIHPEYEVVLYDQKNLQGNYIHLSGDINNLNFYAFNDRAMSMMIRPKNVEGCSENVVIYTKPDYIGESMIVPIGQSYCSKHKLLNFCDGVYAGSIKVPAGYRATLTKKSTPIINTSRIYTYEQDTPNIQNIFDTLISSVIVEKI